MAIALVARMQRVWSSLFVVTVILQGRVAVAETPTARFPPVPTESSPPEPPPAPVEPHTVPPTPQWIPLTNQTDYRGGFDPPWHPSRPEPERRWYGWQTLIVDGAAVALLASGANGDGEERMAVGAFAYLLGAPVVHLGHGEVGKAGLSASLRIVAPVAGAFVGVALEDCDSDESEFCGLEGAGLGFLGGMVLASALDSAVIANEDVNETPEPERPRILPNVSVSRGRGTVGLVGTF